MKLLSIGIALLVSHVSNASLLYDQDLANGVHFGDGNDNGFFTVSSYEGIELGLRAKLRFDDNNQPQNTFNSNGDGTYSFDNTAPPLGFGWNEGASTSAIWNFEWSIDLTDSSSNFEFDDLSFMLSIDFDSGAGTNFLSFDPTAQPNDNALRDLSMQNSWNMEFFKDFGPLPYNNTDIGIYTFELSAYNGQELLASTNIDVLQGVTVPEPSTLAIFGLSLLGLSLRKKR